MTTDTATRQPKGVPAGGQFAAASHAEPGVALSLPTTPDLQFTADFSDDLSLEHKAVIDHWRGRLQAAGVTGEITVLSLDGGDEDAGGPTVAGEWKSPEGNQFGFAVDHKILELTRYDQWNLDDNHDQNEVVALLKGADAVMTDDDLARNFGAAREKSRIADGWATRSTVRSNESIRFGLPELVEDDEGRQFGQMVVSTPIGEYRVDLDRGAFTSHVHGPEGELLEEKRAQKLFTHISLDCGGNGDPEDLKYGMLYALEAGTGEKW